LGGSGQAVLSSHLLAYNLLSRQVDDLTYYDYLEDASPAFSPDGELLAFARKYLDERRWTLGRQLWLMSALGTDLRMLTDSPDYEYTSFSWHPDGGSIAYVRFNEAAIIDPPELWIINADGGGALRLMIGAYSPRWLP
jgi:Tol biopolymer transport system component